MTKIVCPKLFLQRRFLP